jgi:hypothetical protein
MGRGGGRGQNYKVWTPNYKVGIKLQIYIYIEKGLTDFDGALTFE